MLQSNLIISPEGGNGDVPRGCISTIRTSGLFAFNSKKIMGAYIYNRVCAICGNEFHTAGKSIKTCGRKCGGLYNGGTYSRNHIERESYYELDLGGGVYSKIDKDDFDRVSSRTWSVQGRKRKHRYASSYTGGAHRQKITLGRYILQYKGKLFIDHINGDTLDDRKSNLRLATPKQNAHNSSAPKSKKYSKYKGVTFDAQTNKWECGITVDGKRERRFVASEIEAAKIYDELAKQAHGEFARLNFPSHINEKG